MNWEAYQNDLFRIWPEIILAVTVLLALFSDLVLRGRDTRVTGWITLLGALFSVYFVASSLLGSEGTLEGRTAFGLLTIDSYALFFKLILGVGLVCVLLFSIFFRGFDRDGIGEYYSVLTAAVLGCFFLVSTQNLLMLFLALETLSISSYVLAGFLKRERRSAEAAIKYLVYGVLSSGAMLYGFSLLYGFAGSLELPAIGQTLHDHLVPVDGSLSGPGISATIALVLVLAGFGYKIAAFPFHFWSPDVYEGAPTPVTTFLAVVSKTASFGMIVRFFGAFPAFTEGLSTPHLGTIIALLAAGSMFYGNIAAMLQDNVKRLLAYSSIAHSGYLLMGVAAMVTPGGEAAELPGRLGLGGGQAVAFYLAAYLLMNLGAFGVVVYFSNRYSIESIERYRGLGWKCPLAGCLMTVFLLSLTGLPPTFGFIGKWALFIPVIDKGMYWLALVAGINTAISLFYYFRIVKALFLVDEEEAFPSPRRGSFSVGLSWVLTVLAIFTVYFGVRFNAVADLIGRLAI